MATPVLGIGKLPGDLLGALLTAHPVTDPAVVVGPGVGMDAAAVELGGTTLVVKTDPITFAKEHAPLYLVNVNANDLACLGATPRWMLVTALLPAGATTESHVQALFSELNDACAAHGIALIGGHTEITEGVDRTILVGHMLGTVESGKLLKPGGAISGERLLLSRPISVEGTALLARELRERLETQVDSDLLDRAANLLVDPGISVRDDARVLLDTGVVTALHDPTEGGLATGVREMATSCGAGAVIARGNVPVLPETAAIAAALGLDPLGILASGSLLATVPAADMETVERACAEVGMPYAWIGKIVPIDRGFILREGTAEVELPVFDTDEVGRALSASA